MNGIARVGRVTPCAPFLFPNLVGQCRPIRVSSVFHLPASPSRRADLSRRSSAKAEIGRRRKLGWGGRL